MSKPTDFALMITNLISEWFEVYLPDQRMCSPKTQESYNYSLSLYLHYLHEVEKTGLEDLCLDSFSAKKITGFMNWQVSVRKCCPSTCNNRLAALRSFLDYAAQKNILMSSVWLESKRIKKMKGVPKRIMPLSVKAMTALLEQPDQHTKTGRRDYMLFSLLYDMAARIDELLSISLNQIHLELSPPSIRLFGKGRKCRTIVLMPRTVGNLKTYLLSFHPDPSPGNYLFYTNSKKRHDKISQDAIAKRLKKYSILAREGTPEVPESVHSHQIRRSRAQHMLDDGIPLPQLSRFLGHEQITTTQIYVEVNQKQITEALEKAEPGSAKGERGKWTDEQLLCRLKSLKGIVQK
ncbi:MAG: tyrosine-type recombinase/integrase [Sphaerochaeta sp.]